MIEPTDEDMETLRNARPSWQEDGLGLRGNPRTTHQSGGELIWPAVPVFRRPNLEQEGPQNLE